jgi:hypothetical protein
MNYARNMRIITHTATVLCFEITQRNFETVRISYSGHNTHKWVTKLYTYTNL